MPPDLPTRLRRWAHAVDAVPASDLMDEAAAEIERLRWRLMTLESAAKYAEGRSATPAAYHENDEKRAVCDMKGPLTDEERASFVRAIETLEGVEYLEAFSTENDKTAATLRGLLDRMK